jgi:hypothetical protein
MNEPSFSDLKKVARLRSIHSPILLNHPKEMFIILRTFSRSSFYLMRAVWLVISATMIHYSIVPRQAVPRE